MSEKRSRSWASDVLGGALLGATLLASGCGELTSGGEGEVEVFVAVDSVPADQAVQSGPAGEGALSLPGFARLPDRQTPPDPPIQGTLTVRIQVYVQRASGDWIEVTDGVQELALPLAAAEPEIIAQRSLPAGRYRAVRTVFRRVEANVESGLEIDGEPITGLVHVDLGLGDRLMVDRPIELDVVQGGVSSLAVDLHARRWLHRLDREERRVRGEDFEMELDLRHRP